MATAREWLEGARPRTWPTAWAPVVVGSGIAWFAHGFDVVKALLALVVAWALQIGVNYANDYSDGVRGSDADRVGPMRLVGSGAAPAPVVKRAAFACFGIAALAGLVLVVWTQLWWFLLVGVAAIAAAWFYTGGEHPYGYAGLGEVFVFVFFGLVAVAGTVAVQVWPLPGATWWAAVTMGALACAVLVANNLRDIPGDRQVGKRTLATLLGDRGTRLLYGGFVLLAVAGVIGVAVAASGWALLGLALLVFEIRPARELIGGATGLRLIPVLQFSGFAEMACALGVAVGLVLGAA